jgi:type IV pilus assembly protein PilC
MTKFTYTVLDSGSGRERSGTIEGASRSHAVATLKSRGLALIALEPEPAKASRRFPLRARKREAASGTGRRWAGWGRTVSRKDLTIFTRQLATLVNAGMPLMRGLEVLRRQERNEAFGRVLAELGRTIGSGGTFSDGLRQHPGIFDSLYLNMVKAGEAGSALGLVLERLARFMEKSDRLKSRVKTAMIYPVIIMAVAASILSVLMIFVVPRFEQIFSGLLRGQPLPRLTRGLLDASNFVRGHAGLTLGAIALGWAAFRMARKTRWGVRSMDWLCIRLPVLGELVLKSAVARFTRTLGSLLASGVPVLEALAIGRDTSGNVHIATAIDHVHDQIKQGASMARPLEETGVFPGMIQVGEETGALAEMLGRIADTYDEEVDNAVAGLTSVIEPIMIVLMALVVGVIVIALFLPIVSVIQHLQ